MTTTEPRKPPFGTIRRGLRLKRCPFCGGQAHGRETANWFWVECDSRHAEMTRLDDQTAIERWNRRANP